MTIPIVIQYLKGSYGQGGYGRDHGADPVEHPAGDRLLPTAKSTSSRAYRRRCEGLKQIIKAGRACPSRSILSRREVDV